MQQGTISTQGPGGHLVRAYREAGKVRSEWSDSSGSKRYTPVRKEQREEGRSLKKKCHLLQQTIAQTLLLKEYIQEIDLCE